jgi:hypothetical protein
MMICPCHLSREDLLVAKLSAGRAQDLIDVDALRESNQGQAIERQQPPASPVTSARNELDEIKKEGREEWLRQREKKGSSPTLEELRAKGREDWVKLREQTREGRTIALRTQHWLPGRTTWISRMGASSSPSLPRE